MMSIKDIFKHIIINALCCKRDGISHVHESSPVCDTGRQVRQSCDQTRSETIIWQSQENIHDGSHTWSHDGPRNEITGLDWNGRCHACMTPKGSRGVSSLAYMLQGRKEQTWFYCEFVSDVLKYSCS